MVDVRDPLRLPDCVDISLHDIDHAIAATKGQLGFTRAQATTRGLSHRGRREFSPAGAPDVRITFTVDGGRAVALTVHDPDLVLTARRVSD